MREVYVRDYELVTIFSPEISDDAVPQAIERLGQQIASRGGTVTESAHWGRRKLAYPIDKFYEGNYVVTDMQMEPTQTRGLEVALRISDDVLRHLLVRKDEE
jgi:small subunit ribosomal protein S6